MAKKIKIELSEEDKELLENVRKNAADSLSLNKIINDSLGKYRILFYKAAGYLKQMHPGHFPKIMHPEVLIAILPIIETSINNYNEGDGYIAYSITHIGEVLKKLDKF